ncbi:2Fe-2S iron-sulfur cluster-binding protein [Paraburkholderia sp. IMGN_8]|uniref:PDR/VanB family oxidoreductase n=1 Tax=Paraburkholderia sp. IMGN_8 TaxID=3136564 RepID=UPI003100B785
MENSQTLIVSDLVQQTARIRGFVLRHPQGLDLPVFEAGAHLDVSVPLASGEVVQRSYSIASSPAHRDYYLLGVLREHSGRGGSAAMHTGVAVGQLLTCSQPKNQFGISPGAKNHLLIAGGIGITPLLSMLHVLVSEGKSFRLCYCARSAEDAAFLSEISDLAGDRLALYFDGGDVTRGIDLDAELRDAPDGSEVYVCGPRGLNEAVIAAAARASWSPERVHFEFFGAAAPAKGDQPFRVILKQSGMTVEVARDESILDAVIRHDIEPLYDCKRGECGLCATAVIEGEVDHRDYVLTAADKSERKQMCICVSRAKQGDLVLDL